MPVEACGCRKPVEACRSQAIFRRAPHSPSYPSTDLKAEPGAKRVHLARLRARLRYNVSRVDTLAWLGLQRGYESFLIVPCLAVERTPSVWTLGRAESAKSTWYHPLSQRDQPFAPSGAGPRRFGPKGAAASPSGGIQDMLLIDHVREPLLAPRLQALGRASCAPKNSNG